MQALRTSGRVEEEGRLARETYDRYATVAAPMAAAVIHHRLAYSTETLDYEAARPLFEEAIRLFETLPPCREYAHG